MIITYYGKQFFKIAQGDMVLAVNPVSKSSKSGVSAKFGADIALSTINHPDYNGLEEVRHGDRVPFAVTSPGDYEVRDIFIKGEATSSELGGKKYINTVYSLAFEGINISFLGALTGEDMPKEAHEAVDGPDILFVPVGNGELLSPKAAAKLASTLEPKMIIPMDYDSASLKVFLKEMGEENAETTDKITLKRKDLEGKEGEVVVLKSS